MVTYTNMFSLWTHIIDGTGPINSFIILSLLNTNHSRRWPAYHIPYYILLLSLSPPSPPLPQPFRVATFEIAIIAMQWQLDER